LTTAVTKPQPNLKCPECGLECSRPQTLGAHRKFKHGISGSSPAVVSAKRRREAQAQQETPLPKRNYTKRSQTLATTTSSKNGHQPKTRQAAPEQFAPSLETAVAVAFGRFTELCTNVAREFDVPPTTFARQLALFIGRTHP
jgi:hypothetical protein